MPTTLQTAVPTTDAQRDGQLSSDSESDTIAVAQHGPAAATQTVNPAGDSDTIVVANPQSKAATRGARQIREC